MPAKSLYKCSAPSYGSNQSYDLFYANIASVYLVLSINSVHGHSNSIVSGLDLTMHTCSLMDLCIIGALLNAFARGVMGSDDFYSCFYDFLLMYQFLCTYVCLLFNS